MNRSCEICYASIEGPETFGPYLDHQKRTGHGDFVMTRDGLTSHFNISGLRGMEELMREVACE